MTIQISRVSDAKTSYEYGCDLRRLYPWSNVADPLFWGSAIATVRPGEATTPHAHDEEETFIILSGRGHMSVDADVTDVEAGDMIYLPRGSQHMLTNASSEEPLSFLTIFWGSPEAFEAMRPLLQSRQAA